MLHHGYLALKISMLGLVGWLAAMDQASAHLTHIASAQGHTHFILAMIGAALAIAAGAYGLYRVIARKDQTITKENG